jgi:hypothetical protein
MTLTLGDKVAVFLCHLCSANVKTVTLTPDVNVVKTLNLVTDVAAQ